MGTIKQYIKAFVKGLKLTNRKLFLAAVILFCLSWSLVNPIKGIEQFFLVNKVSGNESEIIEQVLTDPIYPLESFSSGQIYLTANTLGSLIDESDSSNNNQDIIQENPFLATIQENALLVQTIPITLISQKQRIKIINYTVQEGDTPSKVAASFGISLNTLLWANNLKEVSIIRPGDELTIMPVNGLLHRVKDGQTVGSIATIYKANTEKIIAFNDLPADGAIQIGQKLIIPDGQMPAPVRVKTKTTARRYTTGPGTGKSRIFPYGQCTWYVAQKRIVTWSGHAKSWLANAKAAGFKTGSTPQAGAIAVLTEGGWLGRRYGHVAYVESINNGWVTVSEMNYNCYACKSVRTLKASDWRIRGYIY